MSPAPRVLLVGATTLCCSNPQRAADPSIPVAYFPEPRLHDVHAFLSSRLARTLGELGEPSLWNDGRAGVKAIRYVTEWGGRGPPTLIRVERTDTGAKARVLIAWHYGACVSQQDDRRPHVSERYTEMTGDQWNVLASCMDRTDFWHASAPLPRDEGWMTLDGTSDILEARLDTRWNVIQHGPDDRPPRAGSFECGELASRMVGPALARVRDEMISAIRERICRVCPEEHGRWCGDGG
jgi:hypothetical protein